MKMASDQVRLKWNNFPINITKNIDDLWKDESLVDATICSEGQCIQAHKVILSASSPLLKNIFAVNPCQHPVIILQDVGYRELNAIISFIYKGEINIGEKDLPELLKAAKTLQIRGLSDYVEVPDCNVLYKTAEENVSKKRKLCEEPVREDSSETVSERHCLNTITDDIIPKEEPGIEELTPDFVMHVSDEEVDDKSEIKPELPTFNQCLMIDNNSTADLLQETSHDEYKMSNGSLWCNIQDETADPYSAYPCPFCYRSYTCWGFRRRHIKSIHGNMIAVTCRWCPNDLFSEEAWIQHAIDLHKLSRADAQEGIVILNEAKKVL